MIDDDADFPPQIARVSARLESVEKQVKDRSALKTLTAALFVVLLLGIVAYKAILDRVGGLNDRIGADVTAQSEKLDAALTATGIDAASVRSASNDEYLIGALTYAKDNVDEFETYRITFDFPIFIDVRGGGTGRVLGVKLKVDDELMRIFATFLNGDANTQIYDLYRNGIFFNFDRPVEIVQGLSYQYTPNYSIHRMTCADVRKIVADLSKKHFEVEAQAFVDKARQAPAATKFHVTFVEGSLYQCDPDAPTAPGP